MIRWPRGYRANVDLCRAPVLWAAVSIFFHVAFPAKVGAPRAGYHHSESTGQVLNKRDSEPRSGRQRSIQGYIQSRGSQAVSFSPDHTLPLQLIRHDRRSALKCFLLPGCSGYERLPIRPGISFVAVSTTRTCRVLLAGRGRQEVKGCS